MDYYCGLNVKSKNFPVKGLFKPTIFCNFVMFSKRLTQPQ